MWEDILYWSAVTFVALIHMLFGAFVYHLFIIEDIMDWFGQDDELKIIDENNLTDKIMYIDEHTESDEEFYQAFTHEVFGEFGWNFFTKTEEEHLINKMDISEPKWK